MPSLFRRIGRYPASPDIDPRENRLTEAFAAVLERVDGLAAFLVGEWTGHAVEGPVWIRTQRTTVNGNFVDLELAFGSPLEPHQRVWVEVKHGTGLHEDQLESYAADMTLELQTRADLVLLAPRASMPDVGDGATPVEWQRVARAIEAASRSNQFESGSRWLMDEFVTYLKEEGLADEEALNPAHVFVLSARPASDRAVARLIELGQQHVVKEWPSLREFSKRGGKPAHGPGWWATFDVLPSGTAAATWRKAWFEWSLREDEFRGQPRDAFAFCAGATFQSMKDSPLSISGNEAWLAALTAEGFERVQAWYWRLWRPLYPEQLMAETTLEAQGRKLGEWILESFRLLSASPPPH